MLLEILHVALREIRANPLRSLLTTLGVVIGVAAVITMVALGEGAQRAVERQLATLGANVLTVRPGQAFFGRIRISLERARLTVDDAEALRGSSPHIRDVAPELEVNLPVEHGAAAADLEVVGTWPSYFEINNWQLAGGRLFTMAEDRGRRRVAVLGALVGEALGAGDSASLLGSSIRVQGVPFEVVGVLTEKGGQGFWNPDEDLFIPLGTAQLRVAGLDWIRSIAVQVTDPAAMEAATIDIDRVLRREHRLAPGDPADFSVRDQATLLTTMQETTRTLSFLLAGIATVSLLVGGIGIMNIMLVSVTERTQEIGLRKSLGARRRDILLQFLIEALVLCLAGGALGLAAGAASSALLARFAGWNMAVAPEAAVLALGFSAAGGIFFGLLPARRAATLDPIEALRHE